MSEDYYEILGVARDAGPDELKRAYRRLARELHPDLNPDPASGERFKSVTVAYETLSDPQRRRMYDLGFPNGAAAGDMPFGFGGLGDFVEAFFGAATPRGPRSRAQRGQDALIRIEVDLAGAYSGVTREITVETAVRCTSCEGGGARPGTSAQTCPMCRGRGSVQTVQRSLLGQVMSARPCPQCQGYGSVIVEPCAECAGEGRVRVRSQLTLTIPPGVETGTRLHLIGRGEVGPGGGPAGDLYVETTVRPHPVFERQGEDLHCTVPIPMTAAALGTRLTLDLLDQTAEQVVIPAGVQPDAVLTLRGRGMPRLRSAGHGDCHLHIAVSVPTDLTAEQRELLAKVAALRGEEGPAAVSEDAAAGNGFFSRLRDTLRR
ncbi:MAG: molecular chaperone DnaJ [Actinomycetales bacterium]|nr:molecular chaperone DnaJ [Actinomycetales bacterium]